MSFKRMESIFIKSIKDLKLNAGQPFNLCVSGGVDSMTLLTLMHKCHQALKVNVNVLHYHHGPTEDKDLYNFRNNSLSLVQNTTADCGFNFYAETSARILKSEQDCRDARISFFNSFNGYKILAHHKNDLLETYILRLMRGVGTEGLSPMLVQNHDFVRPFLGFSKFELEEYSKECKVKYISDPSNENPFYAKRNWVRNNLIPYINNYDPGAIKAISQSLSILYESNFNFNYEFPILLDEWQVMPYFEQKRIVAKAFKRYGVRNYSQGLVNEVANLLNSSEGSKDFFLGLRWYTKNDSICVSI